MLGESYMDITLSCRFFLKCTSDHLTFLCKALPWSPAIFRVRFLVLHSGPQGDLIQLDASRPLMHLLSAMKTLQRLLFVLKDQVRYMTLEPRIYCVLFQSTPHPQISRWFFSSNLCSVHPSKMPFPTPI